ncbi:MAG: phenylalanine--tRNA ligase beta subunit-related protein [Candidatus Shikimatogenerans bostrichidophilus]|nr:MAG: phenylalanine--tRNA ligase beta subunit-related protein [Candidatus Shikimatogenerans bostrichidophilus]
MNILLSWIQEFIDTNLNINNILKIFNTIGIEVLKTKKIYPIYYYKFNKKFFISKIKHITRSNNYYIITINNNLIIKSSNYYFRNTLLLISYKDKKIFYTEYDVDYLIKLNCTPNINYLIYYINISNIIISYLNYKKKSYKALLKNNYKKVNFIKNKKIKFKLINKEDILYLNCFIIKDIIKHKYKNIIYNNLLLSNNYKINNIISDITNYLIQETGIPLVVFKYNKNNNKYIIKRNNKNVRFFIKKNKFILLKNKNNIIIYNNKKLINLNGIINRYNYNINNKNNRYILLIYILKNKKIRKFSKEFKINNILSNIYKNKINIYNIKYLIYKIKKIFKNIKSIYKYNNLKIKYKKILITYKYLYNFIGILISKRKVLKIIKSLNYNILKYNKKYFVVLINNFLYIKNKIDIINDIIKFLNINKLNNKNIIFKNKFYLFKDKLINKNIIIDNITNILISYGMYEVINTPFIDKKDKKSIIINKKVYLRTNLFDSIKNNIIYNLNRKNYNLKFYEIGNTYVINNYKKYKEEKIIEIIILKNNKNIINNYYKIFNIIKIILEKINIYKYKLKIKKQKNIEIIKNNICIIKLNYYLLNNNIIYNSVIYIDKIFKVLNYKIIKFNNFSNLHYIQKDLTFIVNKNIFFNDFYKVTKKELKNDLIKLKLFDIYYKDLPYNKKSYTLRLFIKNKIGINKKYINNILEKLIILYNKYLNAKLK